MSAKQELAKQELAKAQHDMDTAHDWTAWHAANARAQEAANRIRNQRQYRKEAS